VHLDALDNVPDDIALIRRRRLTEDTRLVFRVLSPDRATAESEAIIASRIRLPTAWLLIHLFLAVIVAVGALVPTGARAGETDPFTGEVTIRVTLEGPVRTGDTFGVRSGCREERCLTEDGFLVCSQPDESYAWTPCSARSYEVTVRIRPGLTLDYALLRWPASHEDDPEVTSEGPGSSWKALR
jgi:hypothetical protein